MRRRQFLAAFATAGLGALAGCGHPAGSISLTDVSDDAALAARWSQAADDLPGRIRELIAGAVAGETDRATVTDTDPPITLMRPVEYESRYYAVSYAVENEREATQYSIEATYDPDPAPERTVAFADLPAVDREKLDGLLDSDRDQRDEQTALGAAVRYSDSEARNSAVVPEPAFDAVTRGGRTIGLAVRGSREVTVADYRYQATVVAETETEVATLARERYRFQFDGLTEDQRAILDAAKDDQVRSADPPSQAFVDLVEKFRAREGIEVAEDDGTWLLRYDGGDWWANVRFPERTPTPGEA